MNHEAIDKAYIWDITCMYTLVRLTLSLESSRVSREALLCDLPDKNW